MAFPSPLSGWFPLTDSSLACNSSELPCLTLCSLPSMAFPRGPTRERWPEHSPTSVRRAASIRSALAVSSSCISSRTPSLWKIFSAPASSRASTIKFCAAWGKESSVWVTAARCAEGTAGSCRHPPSAPVLGSALQGACPAPLSWGAFCGEQAQPARAAPLSHCCPRSNNPPLLSSQPQHCAPAPRAQTFCFLSASFSSRSSKIWNICSTFESVQDMAFICNRAERVAQSFPPSPATHSHSGPAASHCPPDRPSRACCCPGHAGPPGKPCSWAPG